MDNVEKATYPLSHKSFIVENEVEAPLTPKQGKESLEEESTQPIMVDSLFRGSIMYRINWRIRVSFYVLEFLQRASTSPACTLQQRTLFLKYKSRCMEELRVLAERESFYLGMPYDKSQSFSELVSSVRNVLLHRTGPIDDLQDFGIEESSES